MFSFCLLVCFLTTQATLFGKSVFKRCLLLLLLAYNLIVLSLKLVENTLFIYYFIKESDLYDE